jgi:formylmethanofuran dehydrogenase subunit E
MTFEEIVKFHGHKCPGLAIGYRMSIAAMKKMKLVRAYDEELVAIIENDACGVDALQCVTGCTFGKGNLIFHDYGKQVFTIYSRKSRSGVRVLFHGRGIPGELSEDRDVRAAWILSGPEEAILTVTQISVPEPEPAKIHSSIPCALCGENVMETRIQKFHDELLCIPCFQKELGQK